jgi:hypothetical protein
MPRWKRLKLLAAGLSLIGALGFAAGFFAMYGLLSWIPRSVELPLGWLVGIAVDSKGRIYCGTQFYSRVQEYDADGAFLAGWFIPTSGGVFRLRVNPQDELEVATARTRMFLRFSPMGELLEQRHDPNAFGEFGSENERRWTTANGTTYEIDRVFLFPSVSKRQNSKRVTVVATPLYQWLFMGPFPAWLLFAVGGLVYAALNERLRFKRRVEV